MRIALTRPAATLSRELCVLTLVRFLRGRGEGWT